MNEAFVKEWLSRHFLGMLASRGGYAVQGIESDFGADLLVRQVSAVPRQNGKKRLLMTGEALDVQLKCTTWSQLTQRPDGVAFDLEAKTFNDLVDRRGGAIPLVLVVLALPDDSADWVTLSASELVARRCGYWYIPDDNALPTANTASVRIDLPNAQRLALDTIPALFANHFGPGATP